MTEAARACNGRSFSSSCLLSGVPRGRDEQVAGPQWDRPHCYSAGGRTEIECQGRLLVGPLFDSAVLPDLPEEREARHALNLERRGSDEDVHRLEVREPWVDQLELSLVEDLAHRVVVLGRVGVLDPDEDAMVAPGFGHAADAHEVRRDCQRAGHLGQEVELGGPHSRHTSDEDGVDVHPRLDLAQVELAEGTELDPESPELGRLEVGSTRAAEERGLALADAEVHRLARHGKAGADVDGFDDGGRVERAGHRQLVRVVGAETLGDGEVARENPDGEVGEVFLDADFEDADGSIGPFSRSDPIHVDHLVGRDLAERIHHPLLLEEVIDDRVPFCLQGVKLVARRDLGDACSISLTCTQRHQKDVEALLNGREARRLGQLREHGDLLLARGYSFLGRVRLARVEGAHLVGQLCNSDNSCRGGRGRSEFHWRDFANLLVDGRDGRVRLLEFACPSLFVVLGRAHWGSLVFLWRERVAYWQPKCRASSHVWDYTGYRYRCRYA